MIELQPDINTDSINDKGDVSSVIILDVYHSDDHFRALNLGLEV